VSVGLSSTADRDVHDFSSSAANGLPTLREEVRGRQPAELGVLGLVDYTHTPAAKLLQNAVMGDSLADHRRVVRALYRRTEQNGIQSRSRPLGSG
jgi:hypothetical protein